MSSTNTPQHASKASNVRQAKATSKAETTRKADTSRARTSKAKEARERKPGAPKAPETPREVVLEPPAVHAESHAEQVSEHQTRWEASTEARLGDLASATVDVQADVKTPTQEEVVSTFKERQKNLQNRLAMLRESTAEAWDEMRTGFEQAWKDLEVAYEHARKAFQAPKSRSEAKSK